MSHAPGSRLLRFHRRPLPCRPTPHRPGMQLRSRLHHCPGRRRTVPSHHRLPSTRLTCLRSLRRPGLGGASRRLPGSPVETPRPPPVTLPGARRELLQYPRTCRGALPHPYRIEPGRPPHESPAPGIRRLLFNACSAASGHERCPAATNAAHPSRRRPPAPACPSRWWPRMHQRPTNHRLSGPCRHR